LLSQSAPPAVFGVKNEYTMRKLFNHTWSLFGAEAHIALMNDLRLVYRNVFVEAILLAAVLVQLISGIKLYRLHRKTAVAFFEKLQVWTGLYLAVFFLFHVGAVMAGRFILHLDTNYYFGVAGLVTLPFSLFFIPYYSLAVISFFGHIAAVHSKKMIKPVAGLSPATQSKIMLIGGIVFAGILLFALTNKFQGVELPEAYNVLIGK
jgi:hypothetical protein